MCLKVSKQSSLPTPASHALLESITQTRKSLVSVIPTKRPCAHPSGHDNRFEVAELLRSAAHRPTRDWHRENKEKKVVWYKPESCKSSREHHTQLQHRIELKRYASGRKSRVRRAFEFIAKDREEGNMYKSNTRTTANDPKL